MRKRKGNKEIFISVLTRRRYWGLVDKPIDCEWKGLQCGRCDEPWQDDYRVFQLLHRHSELISQENDLCLDFLFNTIAISLKISLQEACVVWGELSKNIFSAFFTSMLYRSVRKIQQPKDI